MKRALTLPVVGSARSGTFAGALQVQKFTAPAGHLEATALVTGTVATASGATSMARTLSLPAIVTDGTGDTLQIDLGNVRLAILWWQIDLGPVLLDITAGQDAADPLKNLLHEAGMFRDDPARLAAHLNRVLDALK